MWTSSSLWLFPSLALFLHPNMSGFMNTFKKQPIQWKLQQFWQCAGQTCWESAVACIYTSWVWDVWGSWAWLYSSFVTQSRRFLIWLEFLNPSGTSWHPGHLAPFGGPSSWKVRGMIHDAILVRKLLPSTYPCSSRSRWCTSINDLFACVADKLLSHCSQMIPEAICLQVKDLRQLKAWQKAWQILSIVMATHGLWAARASTAHARWKSQDHRALQSLNLHLSCSSTEGLTNLTRIQ